MTEMTPAHLAVELGDLEKLRDLLDSGVDPNEEHSGLTLLQHAIDAEVDGHVQSGEPLHVDITAYLLARGADPLRRSGGGTGITSEELAFTSGHWLATALIGAWLESHSDSSR